MIGLTFGVFFKALLYTKFFFWRSINLLPITQVFTEGGIALCTCCLCKKNGSWTFAYELDGGRLTHTAVGLRLRSLTWVSRLLITSTAMLRMPSFVCGLSPLFGFSIMHTRPSSFNASLISRMRIRSRALLENRRSFSLTYLTSGSRLSSSLEPQPPLLLGFFFRLPREEVEEETLGRGEDGGLEGAGSPPP